MKTTAQERKGVQAKMLTDEHVLAAMGDVEKKVRAAAEAGTDRRATWFMRCDFPEYFPGVPEKVVLAKLRSMDRRGLITGCFCGCRGDFERCAPPSPPVPPGFFDRPCPPLSDEEKTNVLSILEGA